MSSFVNLKILTSGKHFATSGERTGKRLFAGMHANMIDQFVLGLERLRVTGTVKPEASVIRALVSANVIDRDVSDNVVNRGKPFVANAFGLRMFGFDPHADHVQFGKTSGVVG